MSDRVYVHEDDWGRVELLPRENLADRLRATGEARAFGEAHRASGGLAWTDAMAIPGAPVPIGMREIPLDALRAALGPGARELGGVLSGYGSRAEAVPGAFAFALSDERHWDVLYGHVRDGIVAGLNLTTGTAAIAEPLHRLGTAFALILSDFAGDVVVDLADRAAVERYLSED